MLRQHPQTIADTLFERISLTVSSENRYVDLDSFVVRRLFADAEKLKSSSPFDFLLARALIYHASGDLEQALSYLDRAKDLHGSEIEIAYAAAVIYGNLGYFSEAQHYFAKAANPRIGKFTQRFDIGIISGAFAQLNVFIEEAEIMGLDLSGLPVALAKRVCRVFAKAGIDDATVGVMLDYAGSIMREEKMIFVGETPDIYIMDEAGPMPCVHISYRLPAGPSVVARLFDRLVERIACGLEIIPDAVIVSFDADHA